MKVEILYYNLLINYISVKSAAKMLSLKDEYTLHFLNLNFSILGFGNSSPNYWFSELVLVAL